MGSECCSQNSDNCYTVTVGIAINRTSRFSQVPVRFGLE